MNIWYGVVWTPLTSIDWVIYNLQKRLKLSSRGPPVGTGFRQDRGGYTVRCTTFLNLRTTMLGRNRKSLVSSQSWKTLDEFKMALLVFFLHCLKSFQWFSKIPAQQELWRLPYPCSNCTQMSQLSVNLLDPCKIILVKEWVWGKNDAGNLRILPTLQTPADSFTNSFPLW